MKHLTPELVNKYIDNELDEAEITFVYKHLSECQTCKNEVTFTKEMIAVLHKAQVYPSLDFSKIVMTKITDAKRTKFYIKNFFRFENNIIVFGILFFCTVFAFTFFSEDSLTQTTKEPSFISAITSSLLAYSSDIFSKINHSLTTVIEEKPFIYFIMGLFSFIFFLLVDKIIISHIKKSKKKLHSFK